MNQLCERRPTIRGGGRVCQGFALVEMIIVLVLLGLIVLIVLPKARGAMVKSDLRSAKATLMAQVNRGKIAAIHRNRRATVVVNTGQIWIETAPRLNPLAGSTVDTVGAVLSLAEQYDVTLTPASTAITFDARGIGTNPAMPVTFTFAKEGQTLDLTVNGLGRIIQ